MECLSYNIESLQLYEVFEKIKIILKLKQRGQECLKGNPGLKISFLWSSFCQDILIFRRALERGEG